MNLKKYKFSLMILVSLVLVGCSNDNSEESIKKTNNSEQQVEKKSNVVRETNFGEIGGFVDENALVWLGVPYGDDTSGDNRWKAPQNPQKWDTILETIEAGELALQPAGNEVIGTENGLNLDIYRPNNDTKELPVIVYLHGGNNQAGNAQELSGKAFVSTHDAIVVSVNYRVGVLGFNPLKALKDGTDEENSGNFALLDIAHSLDWVNNNIENFGGKKDNITVAGFSAGGRDVMAMLISPLFEGKFQKAISFSGGMTIADETKSQEVFATALAPLVVEDKIKETVESAKDWLLTDDKKVKEYLIDVDGKRLASLMGNAGIRMEVFPHLYNDGTVLPKEGFETEYFNDVPLLMVTGEQEFSLFGMFDPYFAASVADNTINTDEEINKEFQFVNKYGGQLYSLLNVNDSAEKLSDNYKSPIYNMELQFGSTPEVIDVPMKNFASFHGVFLPMLYPDNKEYEQIVGNSFESKGAKEMQNAFQDYLFEFIKKGNPNGEGLSEWTSWTSNDPKNLFLDASKESSLAEMKDKGFSYKDVLENMEKDTTISSEKKEILIKNVLNGRWFSRELDEESGNLSDFYR